MKRVNDERLVSAEKLVREAKQCVGAVLRNEPEIPNPEESEAWVIQDELDELMDRISDLRETIPAQERIEQKQSASGEDSGILSCQLYGGYKDRPLGQ